MNVRQQERNFRVNSWPRKGILACGPGNPPEPESVPGLPRP